MPTIYLSYDKGGIIMRNTQDKLSEAIYRKYIEPTKRPRKHTIGIEIEMPVVDLSRKPADPDTSIEVSKSFMSRFGFEPAGKDSDGNINSMSDKATGDNLSFDCSYSNLELSMGVGSDLFEIKSRFEKYYSFLSSELSRKNCMLTGMGVNPYSGLDRSKPVPNERYRMLWHYLHSYKKHAGEVEMQFHDRPDFGTFTSASQVQLDVDYDSLIDVINTFGLLEPYKPLIFANSVLPEFPELLCVRNMLWERSMQGYNPHNIGMFADRLGSVDELVEYIRSQSVYCTVRDGKYIDFTPVPVGEYFSRSEITGEYYTEDGYKSITFAPEPDDLQYLRTFKFEDLTFRGTIEYRSTCCQPISDVMTVAAFHAGLNNRLQELGELLENDTVIYSHGYSATELQKMLSKRELPQFIDKKAVSRQLLRILDIASDGLKERGLGEESLLEPLYARAEGLQSPARKMAEGMENGLSIEHFIEEYAQI